MALNDTGIAKPVTIDQTARIPVLTVDIGCVTASCRIKSCDDFVDVVFLRTDPDDINAHVQHVRNFVQQVVALPLHGREGVDAEEILAFAGFQG